MVDTRLIDEPPLPGEIGRICVWRAQPAACPGKAPGNPKESGVTFVPSLRFHGVLPGATVVMPRALAAALRRLS
jgi:hypothetical protein